MTTQSAEQDRSNIIELCSQGGARATIRPQGAFIESVSSSTGQALVFQRQTMTGTGKDRGGIPVCAPNFGPGEVVGLKQHGFARNLEWEVLDAPKAGSLGTVHMRLTQPTLQSEHYGATIPDVYAKTVLDLAVELADTETGATSLSMSLTIANHGSEPIHYAPGFHPYFPIAQNAKVSDYVIHDSSRKHVFEGHELAEAKVISDVRGITELHGPGLSVSMACEDPMQLYVWTDDESRYICVEPTFSGNVSATSILLRPQESKIFAVNFTWSTN